MKKATFVAVLWAVTLSAYGQTAQPITQTLFSSQLFDPQKAAKVAWSSLPTVRNWRHVVQDIPKGQPTWGYMKFTDIGPYLTWGAEHKYQAYYSPDARNLYRYNTGMTRGQKVTVKVLFPGTYYVYFQEAALLLQLNVTTNQIIANLYAK